jgi:hypothetical protein
MSEPHQAPAPVRRFLDDEPVAKTYSCDMCGAACEGRPAGTGLFVWHRGDELRYEEPPLCEDCSSALTLGAVWRWAESAGEE